MGGIDRRVRRLEGRLTSELVAQIVWARFEEETKEMLRTLSGNVSAPTLRRVAEIIERYKAERYGA